MTVPEIFATFFPSLVKSLFCTDKIESIEWQDLVPRQRTSDCFRDSPSSLRTWRSAVIKSPNFPARSTASPVRFLQGTLVILVRLQTLQFRSFGK